MPTIIDALIVTLGLDPTDFKRGTKEAENVADQAQKKRDTVNKKNDKEQRERARQLKLEEQERKKNVDAVTGSIKNLGLSLAGAVLGFESVRGGIDYLANLNTSQAALGRTASRLGLDPQTLDVWGQAVTLAGGKAEDATQTVADLTKQFQQLKTVGGTPGPLLTLLQQFSVPYRDLKGNLLDVTTIFKNLSARMAGMDQQTRSATLARAGVSQGLIDLFNETQEKQAQELADAQKTVIATRQATQVAQGLKREWDGTKQAVASVGSQILGLVTPATRDALEATRKALTGDSSGAKTAVGAFGLDYLDFLKKYFGTAFGGIADAVGALFEQSPHSRAARNNNPGNIKAVKDQKADAQGFRIFDNPEEGVEAMKLNLLKKLGGISTKDHVAADTLQKLIEAYEGTDTKNRPGETAAYVARVSKSTGIGAGQNITAADLPAIMAAMIRQESALRDNQHARTPNGATPGLATPTAGGGAGAGAGGGNVTVTIENQNINAPSANPSAVADQVAAATQRKITMAQANAGQS